MHLSIRSVRVRGYWLDPIARLEHQFGDALDWAGDLLVERMLEAGYLDFGLLWELLLITEGLLLTQLLRALSAARLSRQPNGVVLSFAFATIETVAGLPRKVWNGMRK